MLAAICQPFHHVLPFLFHVKYPKNAGKHILKEYKKSLAQKVASTNCLQQYFVLATISFFTKNVFHNRFNANAFIFFLATISALTYSLSREQILATFRDCCALDFLFTLRFSAANHVYLHGRQYSVQYSSAFFQKFV